MNLTHLADTFRLPDVTLTPHNPDSPPLTAIPLWQTLLYFGVPGILIYAGTYFVVPLLVERGMPLITAWTTLVFTSYFPLAIGLMTHHLLQPGNNWHTFRQRFRLVGIERRYWKWILIAFPIIILLNFSMEWTQPILRGVLPEQPIIPELFADPYAAVQSGGEVGTFFGMPMAGNWWLLLFWLLWVVVSVFMEEIIWRGYLLPRMELNYRQWAWLVNGLLWNVLFHLYTSWNYLTDMPMMLIIAYLAQKTQSTTTSLVLHSMMVALAYAILIPGVMAG